MKQNDFYEVDGCTDFIPVKLIEEHRHITNTLEVELTQTGYKTFVPHIYSFPKANEPQKVVVPKFVADFYESIKYDFESNVYELCLQYNRDNGELSREFKEWFNWGKNEPIQTLVKMKLYGYEVEQERLYTVEIEGISSGKLFKNTRTNEYLFSSGTEFERYKNEYLFHRGKELEFWYTDKLTEQEIKKADERLWEFAKEVEV